MDVVELKKYIYDNEKIELVLESLGCHNIRMNSKGTVVSSAFPDGDNTQGCCIFNDEYLGWFSFSRGIDASEHKDIIECVKYVKKYNFRQAFSWLHDVLGIKMTAFKKLETTKKDRASQLFDVLKRYKTSDKSDALEDIVLPEWMIAEYVPILHESWYRYGIMPWTRDKFGIAYDYRYNRIIIPIRHWMTGELLGVNKRTTVKNAEELGIRKYLLTDGYNKGNNLYGLYENYDSIVKEGIVVLFEAEKSVLRRDSMLDGTCVALQGHTISDKQRDIIMYKLAADGVREVVIAMDNDISEREVWSICDKFHGIKVSYIKDKWNILEKKDSPVDRGDKVYEFLLNHRIEYDEHKREAYHVLVNK